MARNCSASHCSGVDPEINDVCKSEGWPVGHPVITRDEQGVCQCYCSCLALGTPVAAAPKKFRPIQDFKVGDRVLATGPDLQWEEKEVRFSNGTTGDSVQPFTVFLEYDDKQLIVTADHLFLMPGGKLKQANLLSIDDKLVASDGREVGITSLAIGTFRGGFHHIATSTEDPKGDLKGHLLNTNGVVSADYAVQLFHKQGEMVSGLLVDGHEDLPELGSTEYVERYGEPAEPRMGLKTQQGARVASGLDESMEEPLFVPKSQARVEIPDYALDFIPKEQAKKLQRHAKRPLTDTTSQAWAEYLVRQYKAFYPAVVFEIDWYNEEVNAYAWRDDDGVGHVALLGGLIRLPAIEIEGLALVTAHEVGHLFGGPPFYPDTDLSCEGQADFFGARNVMRVVWFGEIYFNFMIAAIKQMKKFFGLPELVGIGSFGGCSHPPGPCRIETYNAGVDLKPKPACAG